MNHVRSFTIPLLPVSKNVWHNGTTKGARIRDAKIKAEWEEQVWGCVNEKPRMPRPLEKVACHISVFWDKPGPLPDFHNLEMAHEVIADGLVKAGIIADDREGQYERGSLIVQRGCGNTLVVLRW